MHDASGTQYSDSAVGHFTVGTVLASAAELPDESFDESQEIGVWS